MPFGQLNVIILIYTMCKGRLGSRGKGVVYAKEDINHLTNLDHFARWSFLLYINCLNKYDILYLDKCRTIVYLSLTVYFPHMLLNSEHS